MILSLWVSLKPHHPAQEAGYTFFLVCLSFPRLGESTLGWEVRRVGGLPASFLMRVSTLPLLFPGDHGQNTFSSLIRCARHREYSDSEKLASHPRGASTQHLFPTPGHQPCSEAAWESFLGRGESSCKGPEAGRSEVFKAQKARRLWGSKRDGEQTVRGTSHGSEVGASLQIQTTEG